MQQYQDALKQYNKNGEAPDRFKDVLACEGDQSALTDLEWYTPLGVSMTYREMAMSEVGKRGRYHSSTLRQWRHRYRLGQDAEVTWGADFKTARDEYPPRGDDPERINEPELIIPESFVRPPAFLVILSRGNYDSDS